MSYQYGYNQQQQQQQQQQSQQYREGQVHAVAVTHTSWSDKHLCLCITGVIFVIVFGIAIIASSSDSKKEHYSGYKPYNYGYQDYPPYGQPSHDDDDCVPYDPHHKIDGYVKWCEPPPHPAPSPPHYPSPSPPYYPSPSPAPPPHYPSPSPPPPHSHDCDVKPPRCKNAYQTDCIPYFRSIDGSGYGTKTNVPFIRRLPPNYGWQGQTPPDPAVISDSLDFSSGSLDEGRVPHKEVSSMVWLWGQFIDHMIILTEHEPGSYLYTGSGRIPSQRTKAVIDSHGTRMQINHLTPYLDASAVYGENSEKAYILRKRDGSGKMRTSTSPYLMHTGEGGVEKFMLPLNPSDPNHIMAGDVRAEEHVQLMAMHTLWVREHNYWCDKLKHDHPHWGGDELYDMARHIVAGEIQAITYNEWLPLLLGHDYYHHALGEPCYIGKHHKANIFTEFFTSVFRFGHGMVPECLKHVDLGYGKSGGCIPLKDCFFQKNMREGFVWKYGVGQFLLGAAKQPAKQRGPKMVDSIRIHLFVNSSESEQALDLAALNIARGHDHSIPSYQALYQLSTGEYMDSCDKMGNHHMCTKLSQIYGGDVGHKAVDAWLGILCEKNQYGGMLGKVAAETVASQFLLLRDTDPYFYAWDETVHMYKDEIHSCTLSSVVKRNCGLEQHVVPHNLFEYNE